MSGYTPHTTREYPPRTKFVRGVPRLTTKGSLVECYHNMKHKVSDTSFSIGPQTQRCCLATFTEWSDAHATKVGEGEDAEQLFLGEVETGEHIHCPHCGANYLLNANGEFVWVDPNEFELVDAEEPAAVEAGNPS